MYELQLTADARADLQRLDATIRRLALDKLEQLCENCDMMPHKALKGRYRGKFGLRIANVYRAIYTFDRQTAVIEVSRIRHRSVVY